MYLYILGLICCLVHFVAKILIKSLLHRVVHCGTQHQSMRVARRKNISLPHLMLKHLVSIKVTQIVNSCNPMLAKFRASSSKPPPSERQQNKKGNRF